MSIVVGGARPRPPAVTVGGRCAMASASAWLASAATGVPRVVWSSPAYGQVRGLFGLIAGIFLVLAGATLARSPRAWLLLQLLSTLTILLSGAAIWTTTTASTAAPGERWLVALMGATAAVQLTSVILLNQRRARRWCRVDPEGYRTFFWS